jgi:hypothetical protein
VADGIRIQPQPARLRAEGIGSVAHRLFIVRDLARPFPPSPHRPVCSVCGRPHEYKTYHFQLDAEGTITVSTTVWTHLLRMPDHGGFEPVNVVAEPPTQGLVLPSARARIKPAEM